MASLKPSTFVLVAAAVGCLFWIGSSNRPSLSASSESQVVRLSPSWPVGVPPRVLAAIPKSSAPKITLQGLEELSNRVGQLSDEDSAGLANLYHAANELIKVDEKAWLELLPSELSRLVGMSRMSEAFFLVKATTQTHSQPQLMLPLIVNLPAPMTELDFTQGHHESLTPSRLKRHVEAFTIKQVRLRLERGLSLDSHTIEMVSTLAAKRAREERSLNVALEYFSLLQKIGGDEETHLALAEKTQRDRKLIERYLLMN